MFVDMTANILGLKLPARRHPAPSRTRRSTALQSVLCPWVWVEDYSATRFPSTIMRADCPKCSSLCEARTYTQMVFVKKCDRLTGHVVWSRSSHCTPIEFNLKD